MKGTSESAPIQALILELAGGDPLRAQEIENNVSEYWWTWALAYREDRIKYRG